MSSLERPVLPIRLRRAAYSALVALLVPLVAGCGSSGPTGGSTQGAAGGPVAAAYAYAHCMRSHGATSFPDPHVSTSPGQVAISQQAAPVSAAQAPAFKAAEHACRGILAAIGNGPADHGPGRSVLLAFARCLRSHGLSSFPDPNGQGRVTRQMITAAGVNLHAPAFLSAAKACIGVTHGAITPADIRAAISGPH